MPSETVYPIDWSHPPPYTGQYPLSSTYCTLQCGLGCKSQNLLHWVSHDRATFGMWDQRIACAATQGIIEKELTSRVEQSVLRWFRHVMRMYLARDGCRWMLGDNAQKIGRNGEPWCICRWLSVTWPCLLGSRVPCSFGLPFHCLVAYHLKRGAMSLNGVVGIIC